MSSIILVFPLPLIEAVKDSLKSEPRSRNDNSTQPKEDDDDEEDTDSDSTDDIREEIQREREHVKNLHRRIQRLEVELEQMPTVSIRRIAPARLSGNNIGIFGLTSTGKSTLVNSLLGRQAAQTGAGETTTEIKRYRGRGFTLWDAPGRNDVISYSDREFIALIKGLTHRLILIQATIKENQDLMRLLDDLDLDYLIIVNKMDCVDEDEEEEFRTQILHEKRSLNLKGLQKIYFISAKYPKRYPDWLRMVNYLIDRLHP